MDQEGGYVSRLGGWAGVEPNYSAQKLGELHDLEVTRRQGESTAQALRALGINLPRLRMLVFGFGAALAAIAGIILTPIWGLRPHVGVDATIPAFLIIVLGGIGSFWGAVFAGLLVGMVVGLTGAYAPDWSILSMYILLIVVLTFRSRGLLGKKTALEL